MFFKKQKKVTDNVRTLVVETVKYPKSKTLSYTAANLQMRGAREYQEDSFAIVNAHDVIAAAKNGLLAVICDGMGGKKFGAEISERALRGFLTAFGELDRSGNISAQLEKSCREISGGIFGAYAGEGGTTAVLTLFYDDRLHWLSVGDSSIYLKRAGNFIKLNKDHIFLNVLYAEELAGARADKTRAESNPRGERLTGFVGRETLAEIDYNHIPLELKPGDVVFLCSDGIDGFLSREDISRALDLPPEEACRSLNAQLEKLAHPKQDNYTGIVVKCV